MCSSATSGGDAGSIEWLIVMASILGSVGSMRGPSMQVGWKAPDVE